MYYLSPFLSLFFSSHDGRYLKGSIFRQIVHVACSAQNLPLWLSCGSSRIVGSNAALVLNFFTFTRPKKSKSFVGIFGTVIFFKRSLVFTFQNFKMCSKVLPSQFRIVRFSGFFFRKPLLSIKRQRFLNLNRCADFDGPLWFLLISQYQ